MSERKYYTDELGAAIKAKYDGSSEVITELQNEFEVPRYIITRYAKKFGLTKKSIKYWTDEETEKLHELWGYKTIPQIAKILGRTENAITVKYKRLGLEAPSKAGETMTANEAAALLKIDIHTITDRWIAKHGLKAKKKAIRGKKEIWMIKHSDLITFLKENQNRWDSRRLEIYALGSEPQWLKDKRARDSCKVLKISQKWTPEEDARAIFLFKQGYTYKQIAEQLQRTRDGVERRLSRLDVWGTGKYIGNRERRSI